MTLNSSNLNIVLVNNSSEERNDRFTQAIVQEVPGEPRRRGVKMTEGFAESNQPESIASGSLLIAAVSFGAVSIVVFILSALAIWDKRNSTATTTGRIRKSPNKRSIDGKKRYHP